MCNKKCAFIRSNSDEGCPFGLPISEACKNAENTVTHMMPLESADEEKQNKIKKANQRVYVYYKTGKRCIYAADIIADGEVVNCNFGDSAQGMPLPKAFNGSPLYPQTFSGIGLDGLYAFPLGFYADNNESRNLFHGLFSLVGKSEFEIIKNAIIKNNANLWEKIENQDELTEKEESDLRLVLEEFVNKLESCEMDSKQINDLINKWNPRKRL